MADDLYDEKPIEAPLQERIVAGRYRLLGKLGSGGAGVVFKAEDQRDGNQLVALKMLTPLDFKDPTAKDRFEKEVTLTRQFEHPNLVRVLDFGMAETGQQFVVMELVSGGTLARRIYDTEQALEFAQMLFILRDVARGVGAAHEQGVVHRDLKPDNILITETAQAKVADFGLARQMTSGHTITHSADTVGTPYYMAPEQFQNHRVDGRADIYSLGIIAFEMATKRRPFFHEVYQQLAMAHMRQPMPSFYEKDKGIPKWFETFVFRCCEKKPDARFQSMKQVEKYIEYELRKMGLLEGGAVKEPWYIRLMSKMLGED
ncbi:MAG: serine/threonine protein kinase [Bdellovibrionales bacterium]|nr:serine/threonine protein kinase [Bdellovibrionales bacterium]